MCYELKLTAEVMCCCWNGEDGSFNGYEMARALGVYLTVFILSPIHIYIVLRFWFTRENYEMSVREPNVMVMMSFLIWVRLIFESMHHLALDLEDWEGISNTPTSTPEIFHILSYCCFFIICGMYFFRVQMFWFKNVRCKEAQGLRESQRAVSNQDGLNLLTKTQSIAPKWSGNRRVVAILWIFWTVSAMMPRFIFDFVMNCRDCYWRNLVSILPLCPFVIVSLIMLNGVKNQFGIISEYRTALFLVVFILGFSFSLMNMPGDKDSYYRKLIDYVFRAAWICCYMVWLMRNIRTFSVENLNSGDLSLDSPRNRWCIKAQRCCKTHLPIKPDSRPFIESFTLCDILNTKKLYDMFQQHVEETLCPENLLFFVDVYIHRKSLDVDPFIALAEKETFVIRECARVQMNWIDKDDKAPSCREIYDLYIKPFSDMEVNIPGKMRRELVSLFDVKLSTRDFSPVHSGQSLKIERFVSSSGHGSPFSTLEHKDNVTVGGVLSFSQTWDVSERNRIVRLNPVNSLSIEGSPSSNQPEIARHLIPSLKETNSPIMETIITLAEMETCSDFSQKNEVKRSSETMSISQLYPVWKALVNTLKSDTLVRFKRKILENKKYVDRYKLTIK